jgi:hypothetical protein
MHPFPLLYNSDTNNMFHDKGVLTDEVLHSFVDEVADSQVTVFLLCQGGQTVFYRSEVTDYWGEQHGPSVRATWPEQVQLGVGNLERYLQRGVEPFDLLVERIRKRGMEAWLTFRMNEAHVLPVNYPHVSSFWTAHPEWRLNSADPEALVEDYGPEGIRSRALNYAIPEVRERRMAEIVEAVKRFGFDGLELDFTRWPVYFKPDEISANIPTMNAFMKELRRRLDDIAGARAQPLKVGVRVNSTLERCHGVGLDPIAWHADRPLDYIAPATFFRGQDLHIPGPAPIDVAGFREALPEAPVYAYVGIPAKAESAEDWAASYRRETQRALASGAAGIGLFNFFTCRHLPKKFEPPFALLNDILDR